MKSVVVSLITPTRMLQYESVNIYLENKKEHIQDKYPKDRTYNFYMPTLTDGSAPTKSIPIHTSPFPVNEDIRALTSLLILTIRHPTVDVTRDVKRF